MTLQEQLARMTAAARNALKDPRVMYVTTVSRSIGAPWHSLRTVPGYRCTLNGMHSCLARSLSRLAVQARRIIPCDCGWCSRIVLQWQVQTEFGLTFWSSRDELAIAADRLEDIGGPSDIVEHWRRGSSAGVFDLSGDIRRLPTFV